MNLGSGEDGEAPPGGNNKLLFSPCSSPSPSSSSSSPHFNATLLLPGGHSSTGWDAFGGGGGPGTRLELIDSSPRNKESSDPSEVNNTTTVVSAPIEKEHMFDKVVTPSDVGKLNRLVIPKQHAEKYFPLDSSTNEKGLLLNFEDRTGKPWRFRYSYWNSSQSYVMTKGWSRFVKEKKLDAGDIVSFMRGVGEVSNDRFYIDWRRRLDAPDPHHHYHAPYHGYGVGHHLPPPHHYSFHRSAAVPWSPLLMRPPGSSTSSSSSFARDQHLQQINYSSMNNNIHHPYRNGGYATSTNSGGGGYAYGNVMNVNVNMNMNMNPGGAVYYLRSGGLGGGGGGGGSVVVAQQLHEQEGSMAHQQHGQVGALGQQQLGRVNVVEPMVLESVPVVHGKVAATAGGKRLRLFGVNMDCPASDHSSDDECDILSSSTTTTTTAQPPLQLRHYDGTPATTDFFNRVKTSSSSSMSLDFDV